MDGKLSVSDAVLDKMTRIEQEGEATIRHESEGSPVRYVGSGATSGSVPVRHQLSPF